MQTIDTRGHLCPLPLIMTKKAIKESVDDEHFTVISDNDTARCNLETFLTEMGYKLACSKVGDEFYITFSKYADAVDVEPLCNVVQPQTGEHIVVLKGETMGVGSDELGVILMRACINSLSELETLPSTIILYNAGVKLSISGRDTAKSLENLASSGVKIIACGACIDYFEIKSQLSDCVTIGNMLRINEMLATCSKVIYP